MEDNGNCKTNTSNDLGREVPCCTCWDCADNLSDKQMEARRARNKEYIAYAKQHGLSY